MHKGLAREQPDRGSRDSRSESPYFADCCSNTVRTGRCGIRRGIAEENATAEIFRPCRDFQETMQMNLEKGNNISIHLVLDDNLPEQMQPSITLSLYRIAQETIHKIIAHGQTNNVQLELGADDKPISRRIHDDGVGFDPSLERGGLGLESMP